MIRDYIIFLWRLYRLSFYGSKLFYTWMGFLTSLTLVGAYNYAEQFAHGLTLTGMTDQVSHGGSTLPISPSSSGLPPPR